MSQGPALERSLSDATRPSPACYRPSIQSLKSAKALLVSSQLGNRCLLITTSMISQHCYTNISCFNVMIVNIKNMLTIMTLTTSSFCVLYQRRYVPVASDHSTKELFSILLPFLPHRQLPFYSKICQVTNYYLSVINKTI